MSKQALFGIAITVMVVVAYAGFVLLGAWIDGRRQAVRERGQHPVTTSAGDVEAREQQKAQTRHED